MTSEAEERLSRRAKTYRLCEEVAGVHGVERRSKLADAELIRSDRILTRTDRRRLQNFRQKRGSCVKTESMPVEGSPSRPRADHKWNGHLRDSSI